VPQLAGWRQTNVTVSLHMPPDFFRVPALARVWLREILRRLNLPPVRLAPTEEATVAEYLATLQTADRNDWRPMLDIWQRRIEEALP